MITKLSINESAKYCANIVKEDGPHSFGGAILFQRCARQLRLDPKGTEELKSLGLTDKDIEFIFNFAIRA